MMSGFPRLHSDLKIKNLVNFKRGTIQAKSCKTPK